MWSVYSVSFRTFTEFINFEFVLVWTEGRRRQMRTKSPTKKSIWLNAGFSVVGHRLSRNSPTSRCLCFCCRFSWRYSRLSAQVILTRWLPPSRSDSKSLQACPGWLRLRTKSGTSLLWYLSVIWDQPDTFLYGLELVSTWQCNQLHSINFFFHRFGHHGARLDDVCGTAFYFRISCGFHSRQHVDW